MAFARSASCLARMSPRARRAQRQWSVLSADTPRQTRTSIKQPAAGFRRRAPTRRCGIAAAPPARRWRTDGTLLEETKNARPASMCASTPATRRAFAMNVETRVRMAPRVRPASRRHCAVRAVLPTPTSTSMPPAVSRDGMWLRPRITKCGVCAVKKRLIIILNTVIMTMDIAQSVNSGARTIPRARTA